MIYSIYSIWVEVKEICQICVFYSLGLCSVKRIIQQMLVDVAIREWGWWCPAGSIIISQLDYCQLRLIEWLIIQWPVCELDSDAPVIVAGVRWKVKKLLCGFNRSFLGVCDCLYKSDSFMHGQTPFFKHDPCGWQMPSALLWPGIYWECQRPVRLRRERQKSACQQKKQKQKKSIAISLGSM